jgi:hypothetical protein
MEVIEIVLGDKIYRVQQRYLSYSSFFAGHMDWSLQTTGHAVRLEEDETMNNKVLHNYLEFLVGNTFTMEEDDEEFFGIMGHPNLYQYPLHIWKMKLKYYWVKDNYYKYNLGERDDGLYGLIEIPIKNSFSIEYERRKKMPIVEGLTIAGGAALFMSGYTNVFSDIDIFPLNKKVAMDYIGLLRSSFGENMEVTASTVNAYVDITPIIDGVIVNRYGNRIGLQVIKRLYSSPSEVVHGFDIDCSGFVATVIGGEMKLYATEMALNSIQNKEIWLDAMFTEERYYWRLMKYVRRGFLLRLPLMSKDNVLSSNIETESIMSNMLSVSYDANVAALFFDLLPLEYKVGAIWTKNPPNKAPKDLGSLLILMAYYHVSPKDTDVKGYTYVCNILGIPVRAIEGDPYQYEDKREEEEVGGDDEEENMKEKFDKEANDWITRDKVTLRLRRDSQLNIHSPEHLLEIYRASKFYKE